MGKRFVITFTGKDVNRPLLSEFILSTGAKLNILRGSVSGSRGSIIAEMVDDNRPSPKFFFQKEGVKVEEFKGFVRINQKCFGCTQCFSLCPVSAIVQSDDGAAKIEGGKCIGCMICVDGCPRQAIENICEV